MANDNIKGILSEMKTDINRFEASMNDYFNALSKQIENDKSRYKSELESIRKKIHNSASAIENQLG